MAQVVVSVAELARAMAKRITHRRWKDVPEEERAVFMEAAKKAHAVLYRENT